MHPRLRAILFGRTTKAIGFVAVTGLLVVATAFSVRARGFHREAAAELTETEQEVAKQVRQLKQARERMQAADAELNELQSRAEQAQAFAAVLPLPNPQAPADNAPVNPVIAGNRYLARHPAVATALAERARARVTSRYAHLYAKLGLSPAQVERFEALMMGGDGWAHFNGEVLMMLHPPGAVGRNGFERQLRALLGDQAFPVILSESRTEETRVFATRLAADLYALNEPLGAVQYNRLADFLAQLDRSQAAAGSNEADLRVVQTQLGLSPRQAAALQGLFAQDAFKERSQQARAGGPGK